MSTISNTLNSVDIFHKNCYQMFKDLHSTIINKININISSSGFDLPQYESYANLDTNKIISVSHGGFLFRLRKNEEKYYFAFMLVKIEDGFISDIYKDVCSKLDVDIKFPLLLVTGIFKPRSSDKLRDSRIRWNWMYNTLMAGRDPSQSKNISNVAFDLKSEDYDFNKKLNLSTPIENDKEGSWLWCENATFNICRLTDIKDSKAVASIADELLKM